MAREGQSHPTQKVPTVLAYLPKGDTFRWGYQAEGMENVVRGVKLLLDKSKEVLFRPAIESELIIKGLDRAPVGIAGEYLKSLFAHNKDILDRHGIDKLMRSMNVQYILTVSGSLVSRSHRPDQTSCMLCRFKSKPFV
ncbi:Heat shock protein 70 family [Penicillium citrinum]|uniref:Heat shock protein 70 family n=1 Tax=Penicillium citrinum TaxID=5077 RepID=A0A9W9P3B2_PENCI|nr:Heat shock protein 70 family [Penicillium citrinum]KAJ5234587.1 Heat shock protein 70 family [Penicillium citrinum]